MGTETTPGSITLPDLGRWRPVMKVLAFGFVLLSLGFIAAFSVRNWAAIESLGRPAAGPVTLALLFYLIAHPVTACGWIIGVRGLGQRLPFSTGMKIAFVSQLGKFLPGNVAHYLARAGLAAANGVTLSKSGLATILEVLAALLAATAVSSIAILIDPSPLKVIDARFSGQAAIPLLLGLAVFVITTFGLRRAGIKARHLLAASACLAVNFILVGLSFLSVIFALSGVAPSPAAIIGIYAIAWVAGYLVPGAPAGLGVREAVLVAWLSPIVGPGLAIGCAILHRLVTAFADGLAGLTGYAWTRLARS